MFNCIEITSSSAGKTKLLKVNFNNCVAQASLFHFSNLRPHPLLKRRSCAPKEPFASFWICALVVQNFLFWFNSFGLVFEKMPLFAYFYLANASFSISSHFPGFRVFRVFRVSKDHEGWSWVNFHFCTISLFAFFRCFAENFSPWGVQGSLLYTPHPPGSLVRHQIWFETPHNRPTG